MGELAQKIGPWAVAWVKKKIQNLEEKSRETQAKELLKYKFMLLNQFGEGERSKEWRNDLQHVGGEITRQLCPNWKTDPDDRKIFDVFKKNVELLRCPRQDWFKPKVYKWLKEGEARRVAAKTPSIAWYPHNAIQVAHHIFLTKGDEEALVHYLRHPSRYKGEIKNLVDARKKEKDRRPVRLSFEQQKQNFEAEVRALQQRVQQREEKVKQLEEARLNEQKSFEARLRALQQQIQQREGRVKQRETRLTERELQVKDREQKLRIWEQKLKVREQQLREIYAR